VTAAVELADKEGLGAVSMARVAKALGFTTMSLYRHVASKDELVRRMLDEVLGTAPTLASTDWRAGLEQWSRAMLAILDRHPWGIDIPITGILGTHAQLSWLDRALEAQAGTGLHDGEKAEIALLLNGYVFWAARLRSQVSPEATDVIPSALDIERYPAPASAVAAGIFRDGSTPEDDFACGLERILDGVGALIAQRSA